MSILKETGFIVVMVALAIFYLRIIQLRGRKRRLERKLSIARLKSANKKKVAQSFITAERDPNKPPYGITSWYLVIIAIILMLFGTAVKTSIAFIEPIETYWWVPTTLGVLLFTFCFKVEV